MEASKCARRIVKLAVRNSSLAEGVSKTARAHAMLEALISPKPQNPRRNASAVMASKSAGASWPAVANAHAVLDRPCLLKPPNPRRTSRDCLKEPRCLVARGGEAPYSAVGGSIAP